MGRPRAAWIAAFWLAVRGWDDWPLRPDHWDPKDGQYTIKLQQQDIPVVGEEIPYNKTAFFAWVSLGTAAGQQAFSVVFDTGSAHIIVPSELCRDESCKVHRRFLTKESPTAVDVDADGSPVLKGQARDQITIAFGTGEVTGVFVKDQVCLGSSTPASGPACTEMIAIVAIEMAEDPFVQFKFDGVLGLAMEGLSQTREFNFVHQMLGQSGQMRDPFFAVWIARHGAHEPGEITFGGWRPERMETGLQWVPVSYPEYGYWLLDVYALRIGGKLSSFCYSGCKVVIDTGTSLIAAPSRFVDPLYYSLNDAIWGHPKLGVQRGGRSCEPHVPAGLLEFVLERNVTLALNPRDYGIVEKPKSKKRRWKCEPMLMAIDIPPPIGPSLFILGEPFFRKYYTVFDGIRGNLGFAVAKHAE